ncbi:unnamed protein product [Mycena citricolor]|uniref:P-loop containing nucleoside triphosphate hydrolase protein n=1 Tax=Mycena citricolor TaxID=2018698 RepID=A0AAD2K389_9AGAR|nr:unnamed protein product [Mycena citricolor]
MHLAAIGFGTLLFSGSALSTVIPMQAHSDGDLLNLGIVASRAPQGQHTRIQSEQVVSGIDRNLGLDAADLLDPVIHEVSDIGDKASTAAKQGLGKLLSLVVSDEDRQSNKAAADLKVAKHPASEAKQAGGDADGSLGVVKTLFNLLGTAVTGAVGKVESVADSVLDTVRMVPSHRIGVRVVELVKEPVLILLLEYLWKIARKRGGLAGCGAEDVGSIEKRDQRRLNPVITQCRVARLAGCIALLTLSFLPSKSEGTLEISRVGIQTVPYLYAAILAVASSLGRGTWAGRLQRHISLVLFPAFVVYFYWDVVPLGTFTEPPLDRTDGQILWIRLALLFITATLIPAFTPREYFPLHPESENPTENVNPEETASLAVFLSWSFLDRIVFRANRDQSFEEADLDPLCEADRAEFVTEKSLPFVMVGAQSRRHLFFRLLRVFWRQYIFVAVLLVLRVGVNMVQPWALNRLLSYLETRDQPGHVIRPWVWIVVMFLSPIASTIFAALFLYLNGLVVVRAEALLTHIIFKHSLRIRVKAETSPSVVEDATPVVTETAIPSSDSSETVADEDGPPTTSGDSPSFKPQTQNLTGKINNLMTTDMREIENNVDFPYLIIYIPLQIILSTIFLYSLLGWAVFVGVGALVALGPVPGYLMKLVSGTQKQRMAKMDERVQSVTEAVKALRMIKLFGWESRISQRINAQREAELGWVKRLRILAVGSQLANATIPTLIMKQPLNASKVFASINLFDLIGFALSQVTYYAESAVQAKVSLDRIDTFLHETDLLDDGDVDELEGDEIGFRNVAYAWSETATSDLARHERQFILRIEDEILFKRGKINAVVGPTGSGKTSLLMALLGEMHQLPSSASACSSLPRAGGVAYAAQESWVLNDTIRANILFNSSEIDEERYRKVLYACALESDLKMFRAGDATEVGENGLTLSGGQKARLTLARAIYSNAEILLLDDILAALDAHTAQWICDKCLRGSLIENRTVILVTHNLPLVRPLASYIVSIGADGRAIGENWNLTPLTVAEITDAPVPKEEIVDGSDDAIKSADGKLIVAEEVSAGHVGCEDVSECDLTSLVPPRILRRWLSRYCILATDASRRTDLDDGPACNMLVSPVFDYSLIHRNLVYVSPLRYCSPIILGRSLVEQLSRWLDTTPTSRIIARVTGDMSSVDDKIATLTPPASIIGMAILTQFVTIVLYSPVFLLPGILVAGAGTWVAQMYIHSQLPVKRILSNARAPVLANLSAAMAGLISIRAYSAQAKFISESLTRIDRYSRANRNFFNLNRWVSFRIDLLGAVFAATVTTYLIYVKRSEASEAGLLIGLAVRSTSILLGFIQVFNTLEVEANSLERIKAYLDIEHEKPPTEAGRAPAYWPASGALRVENLSAKYDVDGPLVLKDVSFEVKPGERVGIVGRTGSGKSSLTLSLLRCIPTTGTISYDGIDTSTLNLEAVRSSIAIIPQVPELLTGSLRSNLDPFNQFGDLEMNQALRAAGLAALQDSEEHKITLDTDIAAGGANLSVGQRQILALARAMLRDSKLLILDEATSSIDYKTDAIIQHTLREELSADVSLLVVAHRLQTVMDYDKIMVLDSGCIVEFDAPAVLLQNPHGKFRALVDESGDRETLYQLAGAPLTA